jgi:hypothetical protein
VNATLDHEDLRKFVRFCLVAVIFLILCVCAALAEEPRWLTYEQAQAVYAGLIELDGPRKAIKDSGMIERGTYDFDMKTAITIADDTARAKECASLFQVGNNALQKKWADSKTGKVPDERMNDYVSELTASGKDLCGSHDFVAIKWEDLKPNANKFPPSVVSNLLPILIMPDVK